MKYYCMISEWRNLVNEWQRNGIQAQIREFDEEGQDGDCLKMRALAILEADQAFRDGIDQREHPTRFLA
jgi:hypothetical protein